MPLQQPDILTPKRYDEHHDLICFVICFMWLVISGEAAGRHWEDGRMLNMKMKGSDMIQYKLNCFSVFSAEARTFFSGMFRSVQTKEIEVVAMNFARTRPENKHIHGLSIHNVNNCHMNSLKKKDI